MGENTFLFLVGLSRNDSGGSRSKAQLGEFCARRSEALSMNERRDVVRLWHPLLQREREKYREGERVREGEVGGEKLWHERALLRWPCVKADSPGGRINGAHRGQYCTQFIHDAIKKVDFGAIGLFHTFLTQD